MYREKNSHAPEILDNGQIRFNLWAPSAKNVDVIIDGQDPVPMDVGENGWYHLISQKAKIGSLYNFRIDNGSIVPDPASLFQPQDVEGPSQVIDLTKLPQGISYNRRPWPENVIYEIHIGTFTNEGNYAGVKNDLKRLADLGITAIELMPLNDVPGGRDWGYDGVLLNAPNSTYGTPENLKDLINTAHQYGIMVYLDVVYNHFGPSGNDLNKYAANFFTNKHCTGWGPAVNLEGEDGQVVRQFLIDNATQWIEHYGFDGLRFDAVHALKDDSEKHFLQELVETLRAKFLDIHLILENEANQAKWLERENGNIRLYNAQWADDWHNATHTLLTDEKDDYYQYFSDKPMQHLARALTQGFSYQGELFKDHFRGEPSGHLPPDAFVFFLQNHDQIGNRAMGERLSQLLDKEKIRQALAMLLLNPHIPMLFMGEEWQSKSPFLFFVDPPDESAAQRVRDGRRSEFAGFSAFQDEENLKKIPDPADPKTERISRLNRTERDMPEHQEFEALTHELLCLRQQYVIPKLKAGFCCAAAEIFGRNPGAEQAIDVSWKAADEEVLRIITNFSDESLSMPHLKNGNTIWNSHKEPLDDLLRPHQIIARIESDRVAL